LQSAYPYPPHTNQLQGTTVRIVRRLPSDRFVGDGNGVEGIEDGSGNGDVAIDRLIWVAKSK